MPWSLWDRRLTPGFSFAEALVLNDISAKKKHLKFSGTILTPSICVKLYRTWIDVDNNLHLSATDWKARSLTWLWENVD